MKACLVILAIVAVLALVEVLFRISYRRRHGRPYHVALKFPWHRNHVIPHPYLSFAYKPEEVIDQNQLLPYDLHPNEYYSFKEPLRLNNVGHFGRDFDTRKGPDVLRVACLGNSSTANNVADCRRDYSYPGLLEECLTRNLTEKGYPKRIEVYNCGIGGWVSPDILIDFILNVLPARPDYVILCHGFTDLHLYLMERFARDYSHGRHNLGEKIGRIRWASYFPKIRFWHSYEWLKDTLVGTGNVRNEVWRAVRKLPPDLSRPYGDLTVEKSIIRSIFVLCRHYGIRGMIASYPFHAYKSDSLTRKMAEGVAIENRHSRELAEEFVLPFVDQIGLIPADARHYLDWVHLTPAGMDAFARNCGDALVADLVKRGEFTSPKLA
jgi:hypothetical protein